MNLFKNLKVKRDKKLLEHLDDCNLDKIESILFYKIQTPEGVMRYISFFKRKRNLYWL